MPYSFNPHNHVKIWLSKDPNIFMNFENQTRLIEMRELNPYDTFNLIYDSRLLNAKALAELQVFCKENRINGVDAASDEFKAQLTTPEEKELYEKFYFDEITHLEEGGNLGVASDILRLLPSSYRLGIYTDMDVPVDTHQYVKEEPGQAPELLDVEGLTEPLLLNIGSLKLIGNKETIIALNEIIIVADEEAAKAQIANIQRNVLSKLQTYSSDYIESTEHALSQNSLLNRVLLKCMKNRPESAYIIKSTQIKEGPKGFTSRELRGYINEIMTDPEKYVEFHKKVEEAKRAEKTSSTPMPEITKKEIIEGLRATLKAELGFIKWMFFHREFREGKRLLSLSEDAFLSEMMKKERSLYVKSIVVCTTGPIAVTKSLFGDYIFTSKEVEALARPKAFSHYRLDKVYLSRNVIPIHENAFGFLRYLGAEVGVRSDSSWLEDGMSLIHKKNEKLLDIKQKLKETLPDELYRLKQGIEKHIVRLEKENRGWFGFFQRSRREQKILALQNIAACFDTNTQEFNITQFKAVLQSLNKKVVFSGFFIKRTKNLINALDTLCFNAVVLGIPQDKKLTFKDSTLPETSGTMDAPLDDQPKKETLFEGVRVHPADVVELSIQKDPASRHTNANVLPASSFSGSFFAADNSNPARVKAEAPLLPPDQGFDFKRS